MTLRMDEDLAPHILAGSPRTSERPTERTHTTNAGWRRVAVVSTGHERLLHGSPNPSGGVCVDRYPRDGGGGGTTVIHAVILRQGCC